MALEGPALRGPALKGPAIDDFRQSSGVIFVVLILRTTYLLRHQRGGLLGCLYLTVGVGRREVEMLMYANMLELDTHFIG